MTSAPRLQPIIQKLLDDKYFELQEPREGPHHFRCSEIGECQNKLVMDRLYPSDDTWSGNNRTTFGTIIHRRLQAMLKKTTNMPVKTEVGVRHHDKKAGILRTGHIDLVWPTGKWLVVVDWKTCNRDTFDIHKRELPRTYRWQIHNYGDMIAEKRSHKRGRVLCVVMLLNMNSGEIYSHEEPLSDNVIQLSKEHMLAVLKCVAKEQHGKQEYWRDQFPCTYCDHQRACWNLPADWRGGENVYLNKPANKKEKKLVQLAIRGNMQISEAAISAADGERITRSAMLKLMKLTKAKTLVVPKVGKIYQTKKGVTFRKESLRG